MEQEFRYDAARARQQALIDEAADQRLLSSGSRQPPPVALRRWMASRLRRVADRLEPAPRSLAPVKRYDF